MSKVKRNDFEEAEGGNSTAKDVKQESITENRANYEANEFLENYDSIIHPENLPLELPKMRELSSWINNSKGKTHPTIGLMTAITSMSAISAGAIYTHTYSSVSLYTVISLPTGTGKAVLLSASKRVAGDAVTSQGLTSKGALSDLLEVSPAITKLDDEFGDKLASMVLDKSSHLSVLLAEYRTLWSMGKHDTYETTRYSSGGGKHNNTESKTIKSPCFGIAGLTTKKQFFDKLSYDMISDGTLNRFIIVDGSSISSIFPDDIIYNIPLSITQHIERLIASFDLSNPKRLMLSSDAEQYLRRNIGDADLPNTLISDYAKDDDTKREISIRWAENSVKLATGIASYEMFSEVPKWLLHWAYSFISLSGQNFLEHFEENKEETELSKNIEKALKWFSRHGGKWLTHHFIITTATGIKKKNKRMRSEVISDLIEVHNLEVRMNGRATEYRLLV